MILDILLSQYGGTGLSGIKSWLELPVRMVTRLVGRIAVRLSGKEPERGGAARPKTDSEIVAELERKMREEQERVKSTGSSQP